MSDVYYDPRFIGIPMDDKEGEFWQKRAAKQRAESAKREPFQVPSWNGAYKSSAQILQEQEQKRAEIDADPFSTQSFINAGKSGMNVPRSDPYSKRARWNQINPGVEYPGDDKVL